jgi:hypothetical protein
MLSLVFERAMYYTQNRLSPRYINIATTRYNKLAGAAAQPSPNEKRERKKRETNADTGRSTKQRWPATAVPSGEFPPRS